MEHRSVGPTRDRAPHRPRGPVRLLRGWAAAVVATLLAAGSHTLAGNPAAGHGAGPAPVVWVLTLALAGPLCTALAGRALSWWRLAAGVGSSQVLFHWLYSWPAAHPDPAASAALSRTAAHAAHGAHGPAPAPDLTPGPALGAGMAHGPGTVLPADHGSLAMAAAHVLAAVATVLLLRRGEAMAARVVQLAAGFVLRSPAARLARWVSAVRRPRMPSRPVVPVLRPGAVVLSALRLRGPPVPVLSS